MSDASIIEKLSRLLADVTGAPSEKLGPQSTPANTPGWDSVANLSFMVSVEEEFGVEILTNEAMQIRSLGDMAQLLRQKGVTP